MSNSVQEKAVASGFSKIYSHYEELSRSNIIDRTMRNQLYSHIDRFLKPEQRILELNSGSGIDALYFAKQGYTVLATDIAYGAKTHVEAKAKEEGISNLNFKKCSFLNLDTLEGSFDYVFSNFGGLNCTNELSKVAEGLKNVLSDQAFVTFVIMGKYYPWDWVYLLTGKFRRALIRFKKDGTLANVEGEKVQTHYHTPKKVKEVMMENFDYVSSENLGLFFPSVNHTAITKYSKLIRLLIRIDSFMLKMKVFPIGIGDYYIITFKKK